MKCGPCPTCGIEFNTRSTIKKIFCCLACYHKSDQFKEMRLAASKKGALASAKSFASTWKPTKTICAHCSTEIQILPHKLKNARNFCSHLCYRRFMSLRFDRWIASPKTIALPQAYDEFLTQSNLECLVDGCDWKGDHLSMHMNLTHGITARQFKMLAGFNLKSGIISAPLQESYSARDMTGVGLNPNLRTPPSHPPTKRQEYKSLEGKEHHRKTRSLSGVGPDRVCLGCSCKFIQSSSYGRTLFHSAKCRDEYYKTKGFHSELHALSCVNCGSEFLGRYSSWIRANAGRPVVCSMACRQSMNGGKKKPRLPKNAR